MYHLWRRRSAKVGALIAATVVAVVQPHVSYLQHVTALAITCGAEGAQ